MRSLYRDGDFLRLWGGQTISEVGSRISREGLPLVAVLILGASPTEVGLIAAAGSVAVLTGGLVAGVWVDRLPRRPILVGADLGRALVLASVPLAAIGGALALPQLYLVAFATAFLGAFFDVAYGAYLPSLVGIERVVEGNAKLAQSSAIAEIAGPSLGGTLVSLVTAPLAIAFDALSFVVSAVSIGSIRRTEMASPPAVLRPGLLAEARAGLEIVWRDPSLRALAGAGTLRRFAGAFYSSLYVIYAIRKIGTGPALLGIIISLGGVGALIGGTLAAPATGRFGIGRTVAIGFLLSALVAFLSPFASAVPLALGVLFLAVPQLLGDAASTVGLVGAASLRQRLAPPGTLGRVTATNHVLQEGVGPLGAVVGGVLAERIGIPAALFLSALGALVAALWLARSPLRRIR